MYIRHKISIPNIQKGGLYTNTIKNNYETTNIKFKFLKPTKTFEEFNEIINKSITYIYEHLSELNNKFETLRQEYIEKAKKFTRRSKEAFEVFKLIFESYNDELKRILGLYGDNTGFGDKEIGSHIQLTTFNRKYRYYEPVYFANYALTYIYILLCAVDWSIRGNEFRNTFKIVEGTRNYTIIGDETVLKISNEYFSEESIKNANNAETSKSFIINSLLPSDYQVLFTNYETLIYSQILTSNLVTEVVYISSSAEKSGNKMISDDVKKHVNDDTEIKLNYIVLKKAGIALNDSRKTFVTTIEDVLKDHRLLWELYGKSPIEKLIGYINEFIRSVNDLKIIYLDYHAGNLAIGDSKGTTFKIIDYDFRYANNADRKSISQMQADNIKSIKNKLNIVTYLTLTGQKLYKNPNFSVDINDNAELFISKK